MEGDDDRAPRSTRRSFLQSAGALVFAGAGASVLAACGGSASEEAASPGAGGGREVTLHRQEGCSCCATYADYLRDNGFVVDMRTVDDLQPVRARYRIPDDAVGCHTSVVDGYVVEGHVPVEAIDRLLTERPGLDGISVTGMPANSPGMGDPDGEPLTVVSFRNGRVRDYLSVTTF
jgi:hypothetical protein